MSQLSIARDVVRVVERTKSGKLVRLNMGKTSLEAEEVALLVMLTKQKTEYIKHPYRYVPVAKVQLVKAGERNSLWFLDNKRKIPFNVLKVGASYLLLRKSDFLKKRVPYKSSRRLVVTNKGRTLSDEEVLFRKNRKQELQNIKLHSQAWNRLEQFEVIDIAKWKENRRSEPWINPQYESLFADKLIRKSDDVNLPEYKNLETYEKMLVAYLKKINDPKLTWEERYALEDSFIKSKRNPDLVIGLNEKMASKEANERVELQKKLEGQGWTQNYSKEEMRDWVEKYGAISEIETREEVDRYSLQGGYHFSIGFNMIDNELESDFANSRGLKINIEGTYEWFIFRTSNNWLKDISLEFGLRYALDGVSTGAANALTVETSFSARAFWYPISPFRMNKNIYFLGVGARLGFAGLTVERTNEEGTYNVVGLGIFGGYRYNFLSGWGMRVLVSLEPGGFQSSSRSEPIVHLQESISATDLRVQLGLSYVY